MLTKSYLIEPLPVMIELYLFSISAVIQIQVLLQQSVDFVRLKQTEMLSELEPAP